MIPTQEQMLQVCLRANQNVHLWGNDGEGKSEYFKALIRGFGWGLGTQILSMSDPVDIKGIPVMVDGKLVFMPGRIYREACEYGERGVPYVIFSDEKNTAAPSTRAACLNAETGREVADTKLPDATRFASAANPPEVAVNGSDMQPPEATRTTHVDWELDFNTWGEGMLNGFASPAVIPCPDEWEDGVPGMRAFVVSYLQKDSSAYREEPGAQFLNKPRGNPRTWTNLARLLACGEAMAVSEDTLLGLAQGTVGKGAAGGLWEYWMLRDLVDIDEALSSPDTVVLPERADVRYLLATSLAAEVCRRGSLDAWNASWIILDRAVQGGWKSIAALGARTIAREVGSIPKAAKNIPPVAKEFMPMLRAIQGLESA